MLARAIYPIFALEVSQSGSGAASGVVSFVAEVPYASDMVEGEITKEIEKVTLSALPVWPDFLRWETVTSDGTVVYPGYFDPGGVPINNPMDYTLSVDSDVNIIGCFTAPPPPVLHNVFVTVSGVGLASTSKDQFYAGDEITLAATETSTHYKFKNWVVNGLEVDTDQYTFSGLDSDVVAVATFEPTYTFCHVDTDCPTGFICHDGICVPEHPVDDTPMPFGFINKNGRSEPGPCTTDADCAPGHVCVNGQSVIDTAKLDYVVPVGFREWNGDLVPTVKKQEPPSVPETTADFTPKLEEDE